MKVGQDPHDASLLELVRGLRQAWLDVVNSDVKDEPKMTAPLARHHWDRISRLTGELEYRAKQLQSLLDLCRAYADDAGDIVKQPESGDGR